MASSRWIATSEFTTSIGPANQAAEQILNARREKLLGKTKRIFDPKFTARGSGFPAVLGIVKGHRSDIEFQTQQEIGTTFEIFISASERPVAAQPEPNLAPVVRRTGPNILVVDDDQSPIVFRSFCQTCGNTSISGRHSPGARFAPQRRPRDKPPPRSILRKSLRNFAISSCDGGQFVSHVLQWNTSVPDFRAASNSCWLNVTVWLWSFGQTISKSMRSLIMPPDDRHSLLRLLDRFVNR